MTCWTHTQGNIMQGNILLWDLETGYNLAVLWGLIQENKYLHYSAIQQERYVICGTIKNLGEDNAKLYRIDDYPEFKKDPTNDRRLVRDIAKHLTKADAIIAHNGDKFDLPYLNSRLIRWGFDPVPPVIQIDTKKMAASVFRFNSNRLDYLAQYLGVGSKAKVSQSDWVEALKGNRDAITRIADYNVVDVEVLEKVYLRLAPYCVSKLNQGLLTDDGDIVCPLCGSDHVQRRGSRYTRTGEYERYQCQECRHWFQGTRTVRRTGVKSK